MRQTLFVYGHVCSYGKEDATCKNRTSYYWVSPQVLPADEVFLDSGAIIFESTRNKIV